MPHRGLIQEVNLMKILRFMVFFVVLANYSIFSFHKAFTIIKLIFIKILCYLSAYFHKIV